MNVSVCCWEHLVWRRISSKEKPFLYFFCNALDPPLGISDRNHYQNGIIPSKAFCLWSSLWLLALPWIHPRADLITRAPRDTDRSPEYNEHFCYKLDSRVKNLTTEWNQKQQHFITHASRSLLWTRFVAVAFRSEEEVFWRRDPTPPPW